MHPGLYCTYTSALPLLSKKNAYESCLIANVCASRGSFGGSFGFAGGSLGFVGAAPVQHSS